MTEIDLQVHSKQIPFKREGICGDKLICHKTDSSTTVILADGKGTGVKANLSATFCTTRLLSLLEQGFSFRQAFNCVVETMTKAADRQLPYAVIQAIRTLKDGKTSLLSYGMPDPIWISRDRRIFTIDGNSKDLNGETVKEVNCYMEPMDAIVLYSDGVTHSGIARKSPEGWGTEGLLQHLNSSKNSLKTEDLPSQIVNHCRELNRSSGGRDDISVVLARAEVKKRVTVMTSLPQNQEMDREVVQMFHNLPSPKVLCGIGNAYLIARIMGTETGKGIDLVTHTQSVLSHLFLLLDTPENIGHKLTSGSVSQAKQLLDIVKQNRQIDFLIGKPRNPLEKGVMPCDKIVPILAAKLRKMGKVVTIKRI